jgi:proteasome-associated ATPase
VVFIFWKRARRRQPTYRAAVENLSMPRNAELPAGLFEFLTTTGPTAPSTEDKARFLQSLRGRGESAGCYVDRFLIDNLTRCQGGLLEARLNQDHLRQLLEKVTAPPWYPAIVLGPVTTAQGTRLLVAQGSTRRLVGAGDGVDLSALRKGDEVFLGSQLNVVLGRSPLGMPVFGELATFENWTADGRLTLTRRGGDAVIVEAAPSLDSAALKPGDLVRWQPELWLAFERVERAEAKRYVLEDVPDIRREAVGGQDANLERLVAALTGTLVAPELAARYGLRGQQTVLLIGPPGCGKTLIARVAVAELVRLTGKRYPIVIVKPGEWEDPYVGVTQQNIRACFGELRVTGGVAFLDEIEAIGRIRGGLAAQHADKFLAALLAELDGFADRGNVAVIAATNRKDLIDAALLSRVSDLEITVGRPDRRGARQIFEIHLPPTLAYHANGHAAADTRRALIEAAVQHFYGPGPDNDLCMLRLRDGRTRTIAARELASGRCFEQVCRAARRTAFERELHGGEPGLQRIDLEEAAIETKQRLRTTLTPANAHAYLADLPQDVDVVSVEPLVPRVPHPHRYLSIA